MIFKDERAWDYLGGLGSQHRQPFPHIEERWRVRESASPGDLKENRNRNPSTGADQPTAELNPKGPCCIPVGPRAKRSARPKVGATEVEEESECPCSSRLTVLFRGNVALHLMNE